MDDSPVVVFSDDDATEKEVVEVEDGLTIRLYRTETGASFIDLDWEPGSKWEFLDTVKPEMIMESLLKELFSEAEAEDLLQGIEALKMSDDAKRCGDKEFGEEVGLEG